MCNCIACNKYNLKPEFEAELEFEDRDQFGSRAFIIVKFRKNGRPINYGEVYTIVDELWLDDGRSNAAPTSPIGPYHEHGAYGLIEFKLSPIHLITTSHVILKIVPRQKGNWFMKIRVDLERFSKEFLGVVTHSITLPGEVSAGWLKKINWALQAISPSPEQLLLVGAISIDIGKGEIAWSYPSSTRSHRVLKNLVRVNIK